MLIFPLKEVGFPKNMNNTMGERCETTINFQKKLIDTFNIEVVLQDERLTTVQATNYMIEADISRNKRKKVEGKVKWEYIRNY